MANNSGELRDSAQDNLVLSEAEEKPQKNGAWEYSSEGDSASSTSQIDASLPDINWSASEFIAHDKNISWYLVLSLITVIFAIIIYLLTRDKASTAVILLAGGIIGFYAARKPRLLSYKVDQKGVTIQTKLFGYSSLKSFAIMDENAMPNIVLIPLKRFMPNLNIYLDPSSAEEVIKVLSKHLPQDVYRADIIDRFFQRVRF